MNFQMHNQVSNGAKPFDILPPSVRHVKVLIWVYFWLIIFEGALRKWIFPSLSDALLIIRDPVVLLIYFQAIRGGFFPRHWLVRLTIGLGIFTFLFGCIHVFGGGGYIRILVTLYGVRTCFLHLPLIFIIGYVFTKADVIKVGKWCLMLAVPMAFLMVAQYKVDDSHWLNKATLGEDSAQLRAAMGKVRPPGTFSFITGPATFYPLVTAFLIYGVMVARTYSLFLLAAAAGATFLVLPVSGSRTLVLACVLVIGMTAIILVRMPKLIIRFSVWSALIGALGLALFTLPVGREAVESFTARWTEATEFEGQGQGARAGIMRRIGGGFIEVFDHLDIVPIEGFGIGAGTNVGVKLMTGDVGFLLGEVEWTRNVMEAGPILGFAYIGFRLLLTGYLLRLAWVRLREGYPLPWLIMSCSAIHLIIGQTTQPTTLGFMVFIAGLSLSSTDGMRLKPQINENRVMWKASNERARAAARMQ